MNSRIKTIISTSDSPVYDLGAVADGLRGHELNEFIDALVALVHDGDEKEKFVALNVLSLVDSVDKLALVSQLIQDIRIEQDSGMLTPIIRMIQEARLNQYEDLCYDVLSYAKCASKQQLHVAAFRCLLRLNWRRILSDVTELFRNADERRIVDTLAFFRSIHDEDQYLSLLNSLDLKCQQQARGLTDLVNRRVKEHYLAVRKTSM